LTASPGGRWKHLSIYNKTNMGSEINMADDETLALVVP
jgi:hypothetical protein